MALSANAAGSTHAQPFIRLVKDAGVVGEGGAGFPAHLKYDATADTLIANGCECEPLLYSDKHIMLLHAGEIVRGLGAAASAVGARRVVIAIKRKYRDVADRINASIDGTGIELAEIDDFYPAGDEQVLTYEITGRTVPPMGLPKDVGVIVSNVGTLYSVANALEGKPVTHKVVTVTGEVSRPSILKVPVGTGIDECVRHCGGPSTDDFFYIVGGPIMGTVKDAPEEMAEAVVTKTTGGVIVLKRGHYLHESATLSVDAIQKRASVACIQCRYCTDQCPRFLIGHDFETHRVMRTFAGVTGDAAGALQALMCCECGVCELFSCPMRLSPRRINRLFKAALAENKVMFTERPGINAFQSELRAYRKIPLSRLAVKIGIGQYMNIHPDMGAGFTPGEVRIPLKQHIGAEAVPKVQAGQKVSAGDLVGVIPERVPGAAVHASISGTVSAIGRSITIRGD